MRTMIVHSQTPEMNLDTENPTPVFAHAFGPFDSIGEAEAFDALEPDTCFKVLLPIIGPSEEDVRAAMEHEANFHAMHDAGNGAS